MKEYTIEEGMGIFEELQKDFRNAKTGKRQYEIMQAEDAVWNSVTHLVRKPDSDSANFSPKTNT
jgi:hypothetical protein